MLIDIGRYAGGKRHYKDIQRRLDISVETVAERDLIMEYRRRWGMVVYVQEGAGKGFYYLMRGKVEGEEGENMMNNDNWERILRKFYQQDVPDPNEAFPKDIWFKPDTMQLFELVVSQTETAQYWAEVTSPKIVT